MKAISDTRLSATDWRVLAAIAYSDRFGKNGRHCYATQGRIAEWANTQRETVNKVVKKLAGLGYLEIQRLNNGIEYIVQYEGCDAENTPIDQGCDNPDTVGVTGQSHISKELKDTILEKNSPKVRPNEVCASHLDNPQGWLAIVEREVRQSGSLTESQNQTLQELYDNAEGDGLDGRAIQGQAERIWWLGNHDEL